MEQSQSPDEKDRDLVEHNQNLLALQAEDRKLQNQSQQIEQKTPHAEVSKEIQLIEGMKIQAGETVQLDAQQPNQNSIQEEPKQVVEAAKNKDIQIQDSKQNLQAQQISNQISLSKNPSKLKAKFFKLINQEEKQNLPSNLNAGLENSKEKQEVDNQFKDVGLESFSIHYSQQNPQNIPANEGMGRQQAKKDNSQGEVAPSGIQKYMNKKQKLHNDGKWQLYLRHAFHHYCKSTYATGHCPTFDHINETVSSMNINTFISFCRNFDVMISRLRLIEIFKKSTNFQSCMNFTQFLTALLMISYELFGGQKSMTDGKNVETEENQPVEIEFKKLISFLHVHSSAAYHNKMLEIGIKARRQGVNAHEHLIKPKPECSYKYKVSPHNGRNSDAIIQYLSARKDNKKEMKQKEMEEKVKMKRYEKQEFQKFHKIDFKEKRVVVGGYMSPSYIFNTNKSQKWSNNPSKILSNDISCNQSSRYMKSRLVSQKQEVLQDESVSISRVHEDQSNKSQNFEGSIHSPQFQLSKPIKSHLTSGNESLTNSKTIKGYFHLFKAKNNRELIQRQKQQSKSFQLSHVIRQARNEEQVNSKRETEYSKVLTNKKRISTVGDQPYKSQVSSLNLTSSKHQSRQSQSSKLTYVMPSTLIKNRTKTNMMTPLQQATQKSLFEELVTNFDQQDQYLAKHLKLDDCYKTRGNNKLFLQR